MTDPMDPYELTMLGPTPSLSIQLRALHPASLQEAGPGQ
jgi:hypothetical protein